MILLASLALSVWLAVLISGVWRLRETLEVQPAAARRCDDVTALIPARNEADVIAACLQTVAPQVGRTIVIDDESTDATAAIAGRVPGVEVIRGTTCPASWSGKLWALEQGLRHVETDWVLLLDADIAISQRLIGTLHSRMDHDRIDMISLMVTLRMRTLAERWLIPPFVYFFRLVYPFQRANAPGSRVAAAAGGCILLRREWLVRAGAFESLHDAVIDDCTLAARIKGLGAVTWIGLTHSAHSLRGYERPGGIWRMVTRTAFSQLRYSVALLIASTGALLLAFWIPPIAVLVGTPFTQAIAAAALVTMLATFVPVLSYYKVSWWWSLTLPAAATAYLAMTWASAGAYWRGIRSRWKDRVYERDL